jgi:hypothetical protein
VTGQPALAEVLRRAAPEGRSRRPHRSRALLTTVSAAVALVLVLGACSGTASTPQPSASPASASPSPSPSPSPVAASASTDASAVPSSPIVGVVIDVKSTGLTKVESFTIRTDAGDMWTFEIGQLAPDSLPAGHLREHAATGAPVKVTFESKDGTLVATDLADG